MDEREDKFRELLLLKAIQGLSFEEIGNNLDDLDRLQIMPRVSNKNVCDECGGYVVIYNGLDICSVCGVELGSRIVPPFIEEIWKHKKSTHNHKRWFKKQIRKYISDRHDIILITDDFCKVVKVIKEYELIKGNISRYAYYIIRLSSRRGIKLEKPIRDIKTEHIRHRFDDILYGKVFPKLKWGEGCTCKYYLEWLGR